MKTLVIGANGQIGRLFCQHAGQQGFDLRAMVRDTGQTAHFHARGLETVVADLEGELAHAFEGCEQVVFTAGSGPHTGPDKTLMVDLYGAMRAADLAREHRCRRFVMVSALRAREPLAAPEKLRPYMVAKHAADHYLRSSGVPWLILRPGRLTDEPASGRIRTDSDGEGISISRENTALCLVEALRHDALAARNIDLLDGDTPVDEAFAALASVPGARE